MTFLQEMGVGRLSGKTAIVTAAAQGIGRASALRFAEEGAAVLATDINVEALDALRIAAAGMGSASGTLRTATLDVTDPGAVTAFALNLPSTPVDILFNCAGFVHQGDIFACTEQDWAFSFNLNVSSMYRMCLALLPGMVAAGRGSIVNMSSVASSVKGAQNRFAYGTTKAAVIGLTKSIAADFVGKGIRCNAICPGTVETPSLVGRMATGGDLEAGRKAFVARQPMGRLGQPGEIAELAVYLASDESAFTTGQALVVDGGWSI